MVLYIQFPHGIDNFIIAETYPHIADMYRVLLYSEEGHYWKVYGHNGDYFTIQCFSDENYTQAVTMKQIFISENSTDFTKPNSSRNWGGNFSIYNAVTYSTVNIVDTDKKTIFFQKTPVTEVVIPTLETAQEIPMAITTTLKMIIPIGLIILSMVLAIYLIKSVISQMR